MAIAPLEYRISAFNSVMDHIGKDAPSNVHIQKMKTTLAPLGSGVAALVRMHATVDPTQTKAAHDKKVIVTASKLNDRYKQTLKDVQVVLRDGLRDIQSRIDAKVSLKPDAFAQELRAAFRSMSHTERVTALVEMTKTNNGPALAAITEAPAMLSGVTEGQQKQYRDAIVQMHAPTECVEEAELLEAFNGTLAAMDVATALAKDLNNPGRLAEIDRGVNAAMAAEIAFDVPASGGAGA